MEVKVEGGGQGGKVGGEAEEKEGAGVEGEEADQRGGASAPAQPALSEEVNQAVTGKIRGRGRGR